MKEYARTVLCFVCAVCVGVLYAWYHLRISTPAYAKATWLAVHEVLRGATDGGDWQAVVAGAVAHETPPMVIAIIAYCVLCYILRDKNKPREVRCRKCGYILKGIREPRCSECGEYI